MDMLCLNLCCGNKDYGGVNVDFRPTRITHVVADAAALPFQDAAFERIECYHGVEHMPAHGEAAFDMLVPVLKEWRRCLRPGGSLAVEFPDLLRLIEQYGAGGVADDELLYTLYGRARFPGDVHQWGWSVESMADAFTRAGFTDVASSAGTDYHEGSYNVRVQGWRPRVRPRGSNPNADAPPLKSAFDAIPGRTDWSVMM